MIAILCRLALIVLLFTSADVGRAETTLSTQVQELEDMPLSERPLFREVQSAWRTYKHAECRQRHLNYPFVTVFEECDREIDLERMKDLRRQLRWLHGLPGHIK